MLDKFSFNQKVIFATAIPIIALALLLLEIVVLGWVFPFLGCITLAVGAAAIYLGLTKELGSAKELETATAKLAEGKKFTPVPASNSFSGIAKQVNLIHENQALSLIHI